MEIPAIICLGLRHYSRWLSSARIEMDDYIMIAVTPLLLVFVALGYYCKTSFQTLLCFFLICRF